MYNPYIYNESRCLYNDDLASVFQKYDGALTKNAEDTSETYDVNELAQFGTYSDTSITSGTYNGETGEFVAGDNTLSVVFHRGDSTSSTSTTRTKGMIMI